MQDSIRSWIRSQSEIGKVTFSLEDVRLAFPSLKNTRITEELSRLKAQGVIHTPHRSFFVTIPVQYARLRQTPPSYYIDAMMRHLKRPYYLASLSAAALHGAAHQRPMRTFVMTQLPFSSMTSSQNDSIIWMYRKRVPESLLLEKNAEMGVIKYSNAELTALDLVQYADRVGSFSSVATVLAELRDATNFADARNASFKFTNSPTIQRLGYLYDEILDDHEQADVIYDEWRASLSSQPRTVNLRSDSPLEIVAHSKRWLVNINTEIEVDEL